MRWTGPRIKACPCPPSLVLRRSAPDLMRYERKHPGEIIHIDTKKLGRINGPGHRVTAPGAQARQRLGSRRTSTMPRASPTPKSWPAPRAHWFGVMSDNAFAYTHSRLFKDALKTIGARHITTRPSRHSATI